MVKYFILVGIVMFALQTSTERRNSDIAELLHRPIRALSFPESSTLGLYFALAVPLENPENYISVSFFFEANYNLPPNATSFEDVYTKRRAKRSVTRSAIYDLIANKFESAGFPGRECLLRSICEASEYAIRHNGILGDIIYVIFTPSSSKREDLPEDITEAEAVGSNGTCSKYHRLCPVGLFNLIGILAD